MDGAATRPVYRLGGGEITPATDWLAEEVPVALEYNGISHAVMLATPLDLADFALGFSLSEGLLDGRHELYGVDTSADELGITLRLQVSAAAFARLKAHRRAMAGRTGCGLCGTESLTAVVRALPAYTGALRCTPAAIERAMVGMAARQPLQQLTGAVHAAAWCTADGAVVHLREDIGRHNALDKLIGALATAGVDASAGFIAVTSRASFEMVQKAATAGVGVLAAVSAPTTLAVATAERVGLTLAGFVRQHGAVIYTHPGRIDLSAARATAHAD
ncbi:MAG: formate dehydrogenase accessory sulfurtransferase FdhD [Burkholderiaceae bacterium]|nr:formate dehydrogenase accessory sulfurtransferase FdhD [Burkholderiaceae bacterium]